MRLVPQSDPWNLLVELFLRFNRRLLFVVADASPELSVNESQILLELYRHPRMRARELGKVLGIEKSILSRTIAELRQRGFVLQRQDRRDGRALTLRLTKPGRVAAERDISTRNAMAAECLQPLSGEERLALCDYLHTLADGIGATPIPLTADDAPEKIAIRRLTRSMGFLGPDWFGTGHPIQTLQVLSRLRTGPEPLPLQTLRRELPYSDTMTSRLVSQLERDGLVRRFSLKRDLRSVSLQCTTKGRLCYEQALRLASERFRETLHTLGDAELHHFISLLERFLTPPLGSARVELMGRVVAIPIEDPATTHLFREFVMQQILSRGLVPNAPPTLLAENHLRFGLFVNGAPTGCIELIRRHGSWEVALALLSDEENGGERGQKLLLSAARHLPRRGRRTPPLRVPSNAIGHDWVLNALKKHASRMGVRLLENRA